MKYVVENATKRLICSSSGGMHLAYNNFFDQYKKIFDKHRRGDITKLAKKKMDTKDTRQTIRILMLMSIKKNFGSLSKKS